MPRRKAPEELSVEELRRLLIEKRRGARRERLEHFKRTGRVVDVTPDALEASTPVVETLEGSTLFAKQSAMHPAELRNMVTSPGGTSAAALHELESGRLRTVLSEAVWAAFRRTVELGEQLEVGVPSETESPAAAEVATDRR